MKDRIRLLMESQHMNQQSFASFLGMAPATLSSILQERTRPTLTTVDLVHKKMPKVNLTWLISGEGSMYSESNDTANSGSEYHDEGAVSGAAALVSPSGELGFDFDDAKEPAAPISQNTASRSGHSVRQVNQNASLDVKTFDKQPRKITEIRVFYDDQTWESFVPKK